MNPGNHPRLIDMLTLAALPSAVNCARIFACHNLRQWGLRPLIDDAVLVSSELVTNAVKSTGVMDETPRWTALSDLAVIKVRLVVTETSLFIEVWDRAPTRPVVQQSTLEDESGRGLVIVAATAKRWKVFDPRSGGKVVWAELDLAQYGLTDARTGILQHDDLCVG